MWYSAVLLFYFFLTSLVNSYFNTLLETCGCLFLCYLEGSLFSFAISNPKIHFSCCNKTDSFCWRIKIMQERGRNELQNNILQFWFTNILKNAVITKHLQFNMLSKCFILPNNLKFNPLTLFSFALIGILQGHSKVPINLRWLLKSCSLK